MKIYFSFLLQQAVSAASESCTSPTIPLASKFTITKNEEDTYREGEFTCREGYVGIGSDQVRCSDGAWSKVQFKCTTNVAFNKPTFYNNDRNKTGSVLAVDGDFYESNSEFNCDKIDKKNKAWSVDLQEDVKVIAIKIKTHKSGGVGKNIEVHKKIKINWKISNFIMFPDKSW